MPTVLPIKATASIPDDVVDPMLAAIAGILTNASTLPELKPQNVAIMTTDKSAADLNDIIVSSVTRTGVSAVIIAGGGKNVAPEMDEPRFTIQFDIQIYTQRAFKQGRKAMLLTMEVMRLLHAAEVNVVGVSWMERLSAISFSPMPDPDFVAYSITFERETQF
jgi:hypothetical protein